MIVMAMGIYFLTVEKSADPLTPIAEEPPPLEEDTPESMEVRLVGRQFYWTVWLPGKDQKFGENSLKLIDDENIVGLRKEDLNAHDDIIVLDSFLLPVGQKVKFTISALDVIHAAYFAHFRTMINAVPGMETHCEIQPTLTTLEMRKEISRRQSHGSKGEENESDIDIEKFEYLLCCGKICGSGHSNMRMIIRVDNSYEFENWLNRQPTVAEQLGW